MPTQNTASHYGGVAKIFHWLTALLIFAAFPLGILAHDAPFETSAEVAEKARLFSMHKTVGVAVFFTALLRILWAFTQKRPAPLHPERKLETFAAETAHWVLYGTMVLVPLTGWIHHSAAEGFAPIWWPFGQNLPLIPKNETLSLVASSIHMTLTPVLALTILAHIGGALKHRFIDRDMTVQRMLPGTARIDNPTGHETSHAPFLAALAIWIATLGFGYISAPAADAPQQQATLEQVSSEWVVESGTLSITIKQLGSDVTGSFADWTAQINFDDTPTDGKHGDVDVTIAIGSLTLGSVTQQAMGFDFFNAAEFPTAEFKADILSSDDAYIAEGSLTLRGATVPVSMPFTLSLDGDTAQMSGKTVLNRGDFGIGSSQNDAATLGFEVIVNVELTANR
jgi:cytochrome b561/polyisoprenoid-binding protein YceI